MVVSRRSTMAACGFTAGAALLVALAVTPARAGVASATTADAGGCSATAHIDNQWGTGAARGEIVTVTVTNTSATAATKWTVTWTLADGERIVAAWNATVTTAGTTATAVNASYNGNLAPGAWTIFGMQLWGAGSAPTLSCANDAIAPTSSPSRDGADVTVREADNERTLTLRVGQTLGVELGSDFRPPTVHGSALAELLTYGGYPTGLPVTAWYRADAPGSADVTTQTDYACFYQSPPCARPVMLWTVHINVIAS